MLRNDIVFNPSEYKKSKKVVIVGFAPSWVQIANYVDEDCEIWSLNEFYNYFNQIKGARADRWFEIHSPNSPSKNTPQHRKWLQKATIPIYMQKHFDEIPMSVEFPKNDIFKFFEGLGFMGAKYFTNTISWMIALAIYEGFEEITVIGVDMATHANDNGNAEYAFQRPSCEYFVGIAEGMGIKMFIPCESDLLKAGVLYGYESDNTMRLKIKGRIKELEGRKNQCLNQMNQLQTQIAKLQNDLNTIHGAISESKYYLSNWSL